MTDNERLATIRPLAEYELLIFDCDGVVLDSNAIKTDAFRSLAMPYGKEVTERFVKYHQDNGGISRYVKLRELLTLAGLPHDDGRLHQLLNEFAVAVRRGLMVCPIADGLEELKEATPNSRWAIASGGDQAELREVLNARGLSRLFDAGIHGSPKPKVELVRQLVTTFSTPSAAALMLGDSRLDHEAATENGIDFMFISDWTDYEKWKSYVKKFRLASSPTIRALTALPRIDS